MNALLTRCALIFLFSLSLFGCASSPDINHVKLKPFEKPKVKLVAVEPMKGKGMEQSFMVTLNVDNPNSISLPLKGLRYVLDLDGETLFRGISDKKSTIPANSDTNVDIMMTAHLFHAMRFMANQIQKQDTSVSYQLNGKVELDYPLMPSFNISEAGTIEFSMIGQKATKKQNI